MEQLERIVNAILQERTLIIGFWLLVGLIAMIWTDFYYFNHKAYTQAELLEISTDFARINHSYNVYCLVGLIVISAACATLYYILKIINEQGAWLAFPIFWSGFGVILGLFALSKGVYHVGRWYTYVYDDKGRIVRTAKVQIVFSVAVILLCVMMGFVIQID